MLALDPDHDISQAFIFTDAKGRIDRRRSKIVFQVFSIDRFDSAIASIWSALLRFIIGQLCKARVEVFCNRWLTVVNKAAGQHSGRNFLFALGIRILWRLTIWFLWASGSC